MTPDTAVSADVALLVQWREKVDSYLATVFVRDASPSPFQPLVEAIEYSLLARGKRIRPLLVLAACDTFGGDAESALPVAGAFELIHTYSLVHDDLPAMDNDDLRRGLPTSHREYSEATAILVGDALQAEAYALIARAHRSGFLNADSAVQVTELLAHCAGWLGMVGGQFLDVEMQREPSDIAGLRIVHDHKTGALIAGAVEAGAIVGNASDNDVTHCAAFGKELGWLFQLVDDLLDATSEASTMGKHVGRDRENLRVTAVDVMGIDGLRAASHDQFEHCMEMAVKLPNRGGLLPGIAQTIIQRIA